MWTIKDKNGVTVFADPDLEAALGFMIAKMEETGEDFSMHSNGKRITDKQLEKMLMGSL